METNSLKLSDIKAYLIQKGVNLSENGAEDFINSCFVECDTKNEAGEECEGGDKLLTKTEKALFLQKVEQKFFDIFDYCIDLFKEKFDDGTIREYLINYSTHFTDIITENKNQKLITKESVDDNGNIHYIEIDNGNEKIKKYYEQGVLKTIVIESNEFIEGLGNAVTVWREYEANGESVGRLKCEKFWNEGVTSSINYDKNGNIISKKENGICTNYYSDGTISEKVYKNDLGQEIKERYHKDGALGVKEVYDRLSFTEKYLSNRTIYKNGEVFLDISFDKDNRIIDYKKHLPDGEIDFDENLLNGELDGDFTQGQTGVCYLASAAKSLLQTNNGKALLNEALSYDKERGIGVIKFAGLSKEYSFTKDEIKDAMSRLGTGDPDFTLLCLGYEKFREENGKRVDSGYANELLAALRGKGGQTNYDLDSDTRYEIDDSMILKLANTMKSDNGFGTCGTYKNLPSEATEKGLIAGHDYFIKQMGDNVIIVSDAAVKKDIELSLEEFKQYFGILEFDTI